MITKESVNRNDQRKDKGTENSEKLSLCYIMLSENFGWYFLRKYPRWSKTASGGTRIFMVE